MSSQWLRSALGAALALTLANCGDAPTENVGSSTHPSTSGGVRAHLRAAGGQYVVAEGAGGGAVNADRAAADVWETFTILDMNGGELEHDDLVRIRTYDGRHYFSAFGAGGAGLSARSIAPGIAETFLVERASGAGVVRSDDSVALRTLEGFYVVAESGGGREVAANRSARGAWETFQITLPDQAPPPPVTSGASVAGCVDGRIADPQAYVLSLLGVQIGEFATVDQWLDILKRTGLKQGPQPGDRADPSDHYGFRQQIRSDGVTPSSRIFLPAKDPDELGYYTLPVDLIDNLDPARPELGGSWTWIVRGNQVYDPPACP